MQPLFNILMVFVGLAVLAMVIRTLTGLELREVYSFYSPTECDVICGATSYKNYCNNNYYADGPAHNCNCRWEGGKCNSV